MDFLNKRNELDFIEIQKSNLVLWWNLTRVDAVQKLILPYRDRHTSGSLHQC